MKPGFPNYDWQRKRGQVRKAMMSVFDAMEPLAVQYTDVSNPQNMIFNTPMRDHCCPR